MDINTLKKQADLAHQITVEKKNALEKMYSRQTVVYQNQIFQADAITINLVKCLIDAKPGEKIYLVDKNNNPAEIADPQLFLKVLLTRHQESINDYHLYYSKFKKRF